MNQTFDKIQMILMVKTSISNNRLSESNNSVENQGRIQVGNQGDWSPLKLDI